MENKSRISELVELSQGCISLIRDAGLILIVLIMIVSPTHFKSFLSEAGISKAFGLEFDLQSFDKLETTQVLISNLQNKNNQLVQALKEAEAKINDEQFKIKIDQFAKTNIEQKQKTRLLQQDISKILEENTPLVEKTLSELSNPMLTKNSLYTVGLQTYGVSNETRKNLNQSLQSDGYSLSKITGSYPSNRAKPTWFASKSTVFYYSAAAKSSAQTLADKLRSLTGETFLVKRGAGLGVDPNKKDTTLFVHYKKGR